MLDNNKFEEEGQQKNMLYQDKLVIRKWPEEHGRELHPRPKSLVTDKAYLSAKFGPNISDFFHLCLYCLSVCEMGYFFILDVRFFEKKLFKI